MAKKSTSHLRIVRPPAPIIKVSAPRAAPHKKPHRRRHHSGGGSKGGLIPFIVAGYALGYLDTHGTTIPTVPMLGRAGSLAAGLYYLAPNSIFGFSSKELAKGFAAIAAYELSSKGSISGPGGW